MLVSLLHLCLLLTLSLDIRMFCSVFFFPVLFLFGIIDFFFPEGLYGLLF